MKQLVTTALVCMGSVLAATAQKKVAIDSVKNLDPIEVQSTRASNKAPFTKQTLKKEDIEKLNLGQDLPFLFNQTPNVVVSTDAGNGVGYTGLRIRGTDATRINVTLNGIPYNDAESHGTYFVNMPDFASSVSSVQIQRGVGTSSNGTGAFGATLNFSTNEANTKSYAELNNSFGSFNTFKNTLKVGSGLLNNKFTIDARLSKVNSDGYIERGFSNLQGMYVSAAYFAQKSSLRFNIISGKEKTYQSWNGIDEATLAVNRRYNAGGTEKPGTPYDNETDNYKQTHYQLFYNYSVNDKIVFNLTNFYTQGAGYYENYKANKKYSSYGLANVNGKDTVYKKSDFIRQLWLDNKFYGQLYTVQVKNTTNTVTVGASWNKYNGNHFGKLLWSKNGGLPIDYTYYNLKANKTDIATYVKWEQYINKYFTAFADLQYRAVQHTMNGFRDNPTLNVDRKFSFINPKLGVSYAKNGYNTYISYALANKEPNRDDFEAGVSSQPKHETLHDFEAGVSKQGKQYMVGATLYYMNYNNQLVNTGKINDVGAYTRENVAKSYRTGLELQGSVNLTKQFSLAANLALSKNKIKNYTQYYEVYNANWEWTSTESNNFNNVNIAMSPNVVAGYTATFKPSTVIELGLIGKYVGKQYLDNTQNEGRMLKAFYTNDFRVILNLPIKGIKSTQIIAQANNITNQMYSSNGYTYYQKVDADIVNSNYYYPAAGINFMVGLNIKF